MKKCPKCGNPSYDGAPVCGNCGYNFPKPKVVAPRREDIFQQEPKVEKKDDEEDTITILKENKLIIGTILFITCIVIIGIVLAGMSNSDSTIDDNNFITYTADGFSFKYPNTWKELNMSDADHTGAKFYLNKNNITIEYYNITSDSTSLRDITQDIINYAQENGAYVELVDTINIDDINSSNIILENANGNYTRFVSIFNNGELHVFKMTGSNENLLESEDINSTINSANIL